MQDKTSCEVRFTINNEAQSVFVTKFPCRVGRNNACDVVIKEDSISGVHGILDCLTDGTLCFTDNNSTNGTIHNSANVNQVAIQQATTLYLGNAKVVFVPVVAESKDKIAEKECLYRREGKEHGPFAWNKLIEMGKSGQLREDDFIWIDGATDWVRAKNVPGLIPERNSEIEATAEQAQALQNRRRARSARNRTLGLLQREDNNMIACPHCWHQFQVEDFLFIARHQSLIGDPVLGADAQQRFLPSRFTPEGNAIDTCGLSCPDMACPRCHLRIPQPASEMPPLFLSIVGTAASGKSYFLTTMIWKLRSIMPKDFAISFTDTDAISNQILNEFEETLFLPSDDEDLVALRKTELQGELYNQVMINGMMINLPKPFMFSLNPTEHHPNHESIRKILSRTLVLYDNAGEHFEPGMDSVDNPTTQHLLQTDTIFYLYDPTKDIRFRNRLVGDDPQIVRGARTQRQEVILTEMVNRVKKYSGLRTGTKSDKTLMILVSKADLWQGLLDEELPEMPWYWDDQLNTCALDVDVMKRVSWNVRSVLEDICPEVVSTAESFSSNVIYLPISALGCSPVLNPITGTTGVRSCDIHSQWVEVPMLYFFYKHGFITSIKHDDDEFGELLDVTCKRVGEIIFVMHSGIRKPIQVPVFYAGMVLRCPETGGRFKIPAELAD